jgi:hypothetical protein
MARQKKNFKYFFADGAVEVPSSYQAKCTLTGEIVPIYHKFLQKLVKKKYKNKFQLFLQTFAKKGAEKQKRQDAGISEEEHSQYKLNAYSTWLALCYKSLITETIDEADTEACIKHKRELSYIEDCFMRHFNKKISEEYIQITA